LDAGFATCFAFGATHGTFVFPIYSNSGSQQQYIIALLDKTPDEHEETILDLNKDLGIVNIWIMQLGYVALINTCLSMNAQTSS
jgi:hypothetical protein